jgi:hypothetical protein
MVLFDKNGGDKLHEKSTRGKLRQMAVNRKGMKEDGNTK